MVKRYEAVRNFLSAETCAFKDQIEHFYPQGSMAIDATISSRGTDDEYDIDIIAQLGSAYRSKSPLFTVCVIVINGGVLWISCPPIFRLKD